MLCVLTLKNHQPLSNDFLEKDLFTSIKKESRSLTDMKSVFALNNFDMRAIGVKKK